MGARRDIVQDVHRRQRGFDGEANLAAMSRLGARDCLLDGIERRFGNNIRVRQCAPGVPNQASKLHHQLPEAPPPLNPPPPPLAASAATPAKSTASAESPAKPPPPPPPAPGAPAGANLRPAREQESNQARTDADRDQVAQSEPDAACQAASTN